VHNRLQLVHELLALFTGQALKDALVDASGSGIGCAQNAAAFLGQLHGVGARIFLGPSALQQAFPLHAPYNVGQGRAVDTRTLDKAGLAQPLVVRHRVEHCELARSKLALHHLGVKDVSCTLTGAVQKMNG